MFSNDKNIEILARLIGNLRRYAELRIEGLQLDLVSKITLLASALIVGVLLLVVASIVVLFLSFAAVFALAPWVGGYATSCLILASVYLLLGVLAFKMRRRWIIDPVARLLVSIFLEDKPDDRTADPSQPTNDLFS